MSFLAPFFVAGGILAVSLPILFHMLRRTPKGRMPFSTLMFLSPSPPRLTKRSRLENWPLLLMRALALCLLGLAFGRPFLRQLLETPIDAGAGSRIVVLLDTSASMRRGDLWPQALKRVEEIAAGAQPQDRMAILGFDRQTKPVLSFEQWQATEPSARPALVAEHLKQVTPGWGGTHLDGALMAAVDVLEHADGKQSRPAAAPRQILLVSDLQQGSRIEALSTFEWPKGVDVVISPLPAASPTNAGLQWVLDAEAAGTANEERPRVRVSNASEAAREQFRLSWEGLTPAGAIVEPETAEPEKKKQQPEEEVETKAAAKLDKAERDGAIDIYIPPGQSRVVRAPRLPKGMVADRLALSGDDHAFDNQVWLVPPRYARHTVLYVGPGSVADPKSPLYFLNLAFPEALGRSVEILAVDPAADAHRTLADAEMAEWRSAPLVVVTGAVGDWADAVKQRLQAGGTVLCVLTDAEKGATTRGSLATLLGVTDSDLKVEEAIGGKYAMLADIDFQHPVFAPFADPRYGDFTKIHFWKHRQLTLPAALTGPMPRSTQVLARFDDGSPAVVECRVAKGRVIVLTSSWHAADSQLALSSKFVPLVNGILDHSLQAPPRLPRYEVGDRVNFGRAQATQSGESAEKPPAVDAEKAAPDPEKTASAELGGPLRVQKPDGKLIELPAGTTSFDGTDQVGIYQFQVGEQRQLFAVNLAAAESKTAPLAVETLESLGVKLAKPEDLATPKTVEERRQMQARELEQQQKLWRWLIVAALVLLVAETWYAGLIARRQAGSVAAAPGV